MGAGGAFKQVLITPGSEPSSPVATVATVTAAGFWLVKECVISVTGLAGVLLLNTS